MASETTDGHARKVVSVPSGEGDARWWSGALVEIKLTAEDTAGEVALVEITEPAGAEAPLHVHHREDEGFWVLEGSVTFEAGGQTVEAGPGDFVFGPRDVPHRYTVGASGCRMLFILTPGGFEGLIRELSQPANSRTLPPQSNAEEDVDVEQVVGVGKSYGVEMLG